MSRALLAYDGGAKAREALYVATYLSGSWDIPLEVIAVREKGKVSRTTLEEAGRYLGQRGIQAELLCRQGEPAVEILQAAEQRGSDLILMGGYESSPVLEVVLGSTVEQVLRESRRSLLICR